MLEKLITLLHQGGTRTYADLAGELGVNEALLEAMLEDLERLGYVRHVAGQCLGGCQRCEARELCAIGGQGRIWALTEKGAKGRKM